MKTRRILLHLLILAATSLLISCALPIPAIENPPPTNTSEQQPTGTGTSCEGAASATARTKFTFAEIVPCLNTIELVSAFMSHNMMLDGSYDIREWGGNEYAPAWLIYQRGVDDCDGHAILQCYLLEENNWDAFMLGLNVNKPDGYNICAVKSGEQIIILDTNGQILGPFESIEIAALHYIDAPGSLAEIRASAINQITTDQTNPPVLGLPWTWIWKEP